MSRPPLPSPSTSALWRAVVVLGSLGVTTAVATTAAQALPDADAGWTSAARGALVAATGAAALLGSVWAMRRGLVAAGVPADEPFVPPAAPDWARRVGEQLERSRGVGAVATLVIGLLLGLVGAGLDLSGGDERLRSDQLVDFANSSSGDGGTSGGRSGSRNGSDDDGSGNGSDSGTNDDDGDDSGSGSDDDGSGNGSDSGTNDDDGDGDDDDRGTTPTTKPKNDDDPDDFVCEALDDYTGDVEDLLDSLGLDADEVTAGTCDDIEDAIDDIEDLLGGVVPSVPTTVPSVPTTVTVPTLPVTTTTVTLPVIVTTTTITLPLGL